MLGWLMVYSAQAQTFSDLTVSGTPACANGSLTVSFNVIGAAAGTTFKAVLSDFYGSFDFPITTRELGAILPGTPTTFTLPTSMVTSGQYKVRIVPSNALPPGEVLPTSSAFTIRGLNIGTITVSNTPACANGTLGVQFSVANGCSYPAGTTFKARLSSYFGDFVVGTTDLGAILPDTPTTFTLPVSMVSSGQYVVRIEPSNGIPSINALSPGEVLPTSSAFTIRGLNIGTIQVSNVQGCNNLGVQFSIANGCSYPDGTTFKARLSSFFGDFVSGTTDLGTILPNTLTNFTLPTGLTNSSQYKVRIEPSNNIPSTSSMFPLAVLPTSNAFSSTSPLSAPAYTTGPTVTATGAVCAGQLINLSFDANACLTTGNTFTAQLSNATGGFGSPVSLGVVSPGVSNLLTLPAGTPTGTGYRVQIVSANSPALTSSASNALTIIALAFTRTPTVSGVPVCAGNAVTVGFSTSCPAGALFSLQLSDASGSFVSGTTPLGTFSAGSVSVPIPATAAAGNGYRIRVVSPGGGPASNPSAAFRVRACGNVRLAAEVQDQGTGLHVSVSPNPTEGTLHIQVRGGAGQDLKVELFNGSGQVLRQQSIEQAQTEERLDWDIRSQPQGLYLLRVRSEREAKTVKVVH